MTRNKSAIDERAHNHGFVIDSGVFGGGAVAAGGEDATPVNGFRQEQSEQDDERGHNDSGNRNARDVAVAQLTEPAVSVAETDVASAGENQGQRAENVRYF